MFLSAPATLKSLEDLWTQAGPNFECSSSCHLPLCTWKSILENTKPSHLHAPLKDSALKGSSTAKDETMWVWISCTFMTRNGKIAQCAYSQLQTQCNPNNLNISVNSSITTVDPHAGQSNST
eukprot:5244628-Amphidinium_carterae.2